MADLYDSTVLRASAATSGTSEQDDPVLLPESVNEIWVLVEKTAEANADNLLTVRLQARINTIWFDVSWDSLTETVALTAAVDSAADVTRTPNIIDANDDPPTYRRIAHFAELPSNDIRIISISSGTAPANTFSVTAFYNLGGK